MAVVEPVTDPEKLRELEPLIELCEENGTPGPGAVKTIGHEPEIARAFIEYWDALFYGGSVDHRLKELLRSHLANLHGCDYCQSVGSNVAREMGLSSEKIWALREYEESELFTEAERAALRFAEDFYRNEHSYDELKEHFTDAEVIEIVWFVSFQDGGEKMMESLDVDLEDAEVTATGAD